MIDIEAQLRKAVLTDERTPYRIALDSEISHASMSLFLNGKRSLNLANASKLAHCLGLRLIQEKK